MINKSRIKYIIIFLLLIVLSVVLYIRRPRNVLNTNWGKGILTSYEKSFYFKRINQIILNWQQTKKNAEKDSSGRLTGSYNTYLVIDTDKQAIWLEENGQIDEENYMELSTGTNWILRRYITQSSTVLGGRTRFKIRGIDSNKLTPENFTLEGINKNNYICVHFNSEMNNADQRPYGYGITYSTFPTTSEDTVNQYGSIIVDENEYQKNQSLLAVNKEISSNKESIQEEISLELQKNKKLWNGIEKYFYIECEKQVCKAGYEITSISFESEPDFSSGHAQIQAFKNNLLDKIFKRILYVETYLKIDYIGDGVWYTKSVKGTNIPLKVKKRKPLNLEFLIYPEKEISESQYKEMIEKGRNL